MGLEHKSLVSSPYVSNIVALVVTIMLVVRLCTGDMVALIHYYPIPVGERIKVRSPCQQQSVVLSKVEQNYPLLVIILQVIVFVV